MNRPSTTCLQDCGPGREVLRRGGGARGGDKRARPRAARVGRCRRHGDGGHRAGSRQEHQVGKPLPSSVIICCT